MIDTSIIPTTAENIKPVTDELLKQAITSETSVEVNNVSVSFKTAKGIYTAVKDTYTVFNKIV